MESVNTHIIKAFVKLMIINGILVAKRQTMQATNYTERINILQRIEDELDRLIATNEAIPNVYLLIKNRINRHRRLLAIQREREVINRVIMSYLTNHTKKPH